MMYASHACVHVCVCLPVVRVGEVVYDCRADAGDAPLAVVPSSCDDRQLRSTQPLLICYVTGGQRRTQKNNVAQKTAPNTACHYNLLLILVNSKYNINKENSSVS